MNSLSIDCPSYYSASSRGFTLIEVMIVVAIIGIIAAISIPAYQGYLKRSATASCMAEVKGYSNVVYIALNDQDTLTNPPVADASACQSITDASGWHVEDDEGVIIALAKSPSDARIECNLANGVPCKVVK